MQQLFEMSSLCLPYLCSLSWGAVPSTILNYNLLCCQSLVRKAKTNVCVMEGIYCLSDERVKKPEISHSWKLLRLEGQRGQRVLMEPRIWHYLLDADARGENITVQGRGRERKVPQLLPSSYSNLPVASTWSIKLPSSQGVKNLINCSSLK